MHTQLDLSICKCQLTLLKHNYFTTLRYSECKKRLVDANKAGI
jgi:hypothetical protein